MPDLQTAVLIAAQARHGQTRKNGLPYLLHPFRVVLRMKTEDEMIVATLHDVIEDTSVTINELRDREFPEMILTPLDLLTKRPCLGYFTYLDAIATNAIARRVKIADLLDNLNISELPDLQERGLTRINKYHKALMKLESRTSVCGSLSLAHQTHNRQALCSEILTNEPT